MKRLLLLFIILLTACQSSAATETPAGVPTSAAQSATLSPTATPLPTPVEIPATNTAIPLPPSPTSEPFPTNSPLAEPTASPALPSGPATNINLEQIATGFFRPVYLTHAGDERLFIVEQYGVINIIQNGERLSPAFLDIQGQVGSDESEQGLLSVAFHPNYANNGYFFVNYTDNQGDTVIARFQVSNNPNLADPNSEEIVLTIAQPYANHNGGLIQFGPDGYLYIGTGDGGSGGDPGKRAQNRQELLGKMLRINVDELPYTIPAGNPFANDNTTRPEIWAIGLRNPWRFSFDQLTGDLYIADVGQGDYEEINFQPSSSRGGENYGWNVMEGLHCFSPSYCNTHLFTLPIIEYDHNQGGCSVVGGYVYRGSLYPSLAGNYFFGDYCTGTVWTLYRSPTGQWVQNTVLESGLLISSFGQDAAGELYLVAHGSGKIYHIQP